MVDLSKPGKEVAKATKGKLKKPPPFPTKKSDTNGRSPFHSTW